MLFTACSENDDDDYKWASVSGDQVYFSSLLGSSVDLEDNGSSFTIPLKRINKDNSATIQIESEIDSVAQANGIFSVPSSVSFDAGSDVANIVISYDRSKLDYDDYYPFTLKIAESDMASSTPYGQTSYSFEAGVPAPLKLLGRGTFEDAFWFEETSEVQIYQNTLNPNQFRIMDPFGPMYSKLDENKSPYATITLLQPGDVVGGVTITQKGLVYFDDLCTGYFHSSYSADVYLLHPSRFTSMAAESYFLKSKVIGWQDNGLPGQIQLAPYYYMFGVGGWNNTGEDGVVVITFPGYVPLDLSAELTYHGIFTDPSQAVFAMATAELGEDVKDARAVVVPQDADAEAVADAIAAGELEATPVENGTIYVPIPEDLSGKLQLILVVLNEGEVKALKTASFEYFGGGKNPWQSLGMGLFTDDLVYPLYTKENPSTTYEVEIQENTEEPGLYRLVDPYGANFPYYSYAKSYASSAIEVDATDPNGVFIFEQSTGLDLGDGEISILTEGGNYYAYYGPDYYDKLKAAGYFGQLKEGVMTFPSFEAKDKETGEVLYTYQGWTSIDGDGDYRMGRNGELKIVLPSAVTATARAAAKAQAKARDFEQRLKGMDACSIKERRIAMKRNAPITRGLMLAK